MEIIKLNSLAELKRKHKEEVNKGSYATDIFSSGTSSSFRVFSKIGRVTLKFYTLF